jgi:hypothetical protein
MRKLAPPLRRIALSIAGLILVLLGALLTVAPGPGLLVIVAGLAVLAREYDWAQRILDKVKAWSKRSTDVIRHKIHENHRGNDQA